MIKYTDKIKDSLNKDIKEKFLNIFPITPDMKITYKNVSRMVMLERYSQKDVKLETLKVGDFIVAEIKEDIKFPTLGTGIVTNITSKNVIVKVDDEYIGQINPKLKQLIPGHIKLPKYSISKPLEIYYEQIAKRVGTALSKKEHPTWRDEFISQIEKRNIVPAGRVLYGAGSNSKVTFFNCFVLPMIEDSKQGLSKHRKELAQIMAYGGGVGSNGSTLRPRNAYVAGTNGKSSGAVPWLNDLSTLTDLIQQGGSRRGAQMIMLQVWHPDIIEFIVSKMQQTKILKYIVDHFEDPIITKEANKKLRFIPLSPIKKMAYSALVKIAVEESKEVLHAQDLLESGGEYEVVSPQYLSGANISVGITEDFMKAVKEDKDWTLSFPDLHKMSPAQKKFYDEKWQDIGDVREWKKLGYPVREYHTLKAKELWYLINFCATYSAEPGIFFIDKANEATNARSYGQKVVCTNPCGEQPLTPYAVCNLSAINLSNFIDKKKKEVLWEELKRTVSTCVRFQDNIIDETPYFMEENELQAKNERRIGMGVMGLHDLLIWLGVRYGSKEGNKVVDKLFETIATTAYLTSSKLAKEKEPFPLLLDVDKFLNTGYMKTMPNHVRKAIKKDGIRNSHLLTIAPTGSTGTMIGVSTGLEPYFAFKYFRTGRLGKFMEVDQPIVAEWKEFYNYDKEELPDFFNTTMKLTPNEHVDVQTTIQRWVDSSISKTVNAPKGFTVKQVEEVYTRLYDNGAKGGTVYVDGSRTEQVLNIVKKDEQGNEIQSAKKIITNESTTAHLKRIKDRMSDIPGLIANKEIGNNIGDECPVCHLGVIEDIGGCNTCTNCGVQLKCGI